ncbi:MAG: ATP-binding protein [Telluria sp.]|nr:ATP-binding protein [Telluria sp.]
MRARQLAWIAALLASAALIALAYLGAARHTRAEIEDQGRRQLKLMAPELESALDKFETLPFVLGFQGDLTAALARPGDAQAIARLNRILQTIQRQAKVSAIYLMDLEGNTLAASNWDLPLTFVGKNFAFRPYFMEARGGRAGRFYGIGNTTSEPGYFIAQPVNMDGRIAGVVAVKISLAEFERTWSGSDDPIALADHAGVIFLSNRPLWKYRSLQPLAAQTQRELASTAQYARRPIAPLAAQAPVAVTRAVGRLGWQLMLFPSHGRIARSASLWAGGAALLLASAAMALWALHQRRRRLEERRAARAALRLAEQELDTKLAERTLQLRLTNTDLESKYAALKQTENLLRSTQNELVQAGKLAMLGQMAAGMTHELNQPLAAIRAFADNARTFLERGQSEQASSNLAHIGDASARMGAIIGQLKGFARKSDALATVDIAGSIRASAFLLQSEFLRHGVELAIDTGPAAAAPLLVTGDSVRIEQVFINLLRNGLDAVENAAERRVAIALSARAGCAVVCISDSGGGIPDSVAAQLFEPFFTTKSSAKGLGLGLAISSSIVQAMNGRLTAGNRPGGGAEFEVELPLMAQGD